jgi:PAS domain-containing protein
MLESCSVESASIKPELLLLLIEQTPNAIAMLDLDMRYLLVSQRWLQDCGVDHQTILGRSHYEIFPTFPDSWKAIYQDCLNNATEACIEDQLQCGDRTIWLRTKVQP